MPLIKVDEQIRASPQQVWDLLCEIDREPGWMPLLKEVSATDDPILREGSSYHGQYQIGGWQRGLDWRVVRFDPPLVQVRECRARSVAAVLTMVVQPDGAGALLTLHLQYKLLPLVRPIGLLLEKSFFARAIENAHVKAAANLRGILELTPPP